MSLDKDAELARDFLLDRLDEQQREALQERLFSDENLYRAVLSAEADLIDEFAADQLPAADRSRFEKRCLASSEQGFKLLFARSLRSKLDASGADLSNVPKPAALAEPQGPQARLSLLRRRVGIVLAAGLAGLALLTVWQYEQGPGSSPERPTDNRERPGGRQMTVLLASSVLRDSQAQPKIEIPTGIETVNFRIEVQEPDPALLYILSLSDSRGRALFRSADLQAKTVEGIVVVESAVPSDDLPSGSYEAELVAKSPGGATEPISYSYFSVLRAP